jgi:hypothetical protein
MNGNIDSSRQKASIGLGLGTAAPLCLALAIGSAQASEVIRVDMQPNAPFSGRPPVDFTGVETQAAAANSIFGSNGANTWNYLSIAPAPAVTTNPSFSNLVNSAGAVTNVGVSFTGPLTAADDTPIDNAGSDAIENDYFLISGTQTVDYTISGLPDSARVAFYLYSPNFTHYDSGDPTDEPNRGYELTANGDIINVPSGYGVNNALAFVTTSASGSISGVWSAPLGNEGDWSGFQIGFPAATPETSTWTMMVAGFAGLGYAAFRRGRKDRVKIAAG